MATRMQQRRGTAAQWISTNSGNGPILAAGEIGFESDTNKFKIGDGVNHWVDLTYFTDAASAIDAITDLVDGAPDLLNTLGEIAAALGDDPTFFTTVATNLSDHESDTTNVHGILDTNELATKEYVTQEIGNSEVDQAALAGTGLTWDAGAQQFTVDTTLIQERVTGVSDEEIGYLSGVTSDIQNQLDAKLESSDLTGYATETYVAEAVADVVGLAPATLDTLQEIAAAFNDQPDTLQNLITEVGGKQDSLTPGSNIDITSNIISVTGLLSTDISDFSTAANSATSSSYDSAGSATTAENNAKSYADGLAVNYDPAGSASTAQTNAQNYADGLAVNYDAYGAASTAETNANNYTDSAIGNLGGNVTAVVNGHLDVMTGTGITVNNNSIEVDFQTLGATYDALGAADTAYTNATLYTDDAISGLNLATTYDAKGAAATVQTNLDNHALDESTHGVTSSIVGTDDSQTLTNKTISNLDNTITVQVANVSDLTATATELNILDGITASTTELNYVDGVTSSVQDQLDAKMPLAGGTFSGTVYGTNLELSGNLTVDGTFSSVPTETLTVTNPMIYMGDGNPSNINDLGLVGSHTIDSVYSHTGLVKDATDGKWKLFTGVTDEPTTTINFSQATLDTLVAATFEGNVTGDVTGNADTATALETARNIAGQSFDGTADISIAPTDLTGVTATAAEINILDGATLSTTELNYVDGVTSSIQDQIDSKLASSTAASTYAPIANPTFTGTVAGVTKSMVGLGNVDNTADADKPVSSATQTALNLKADLNAPTFTGSVVLPETTAIGNVSATEIGYLDGVTSGIQGQIDGVNSTAQSAALGVYYVEGVLQFAGSNGQVLTKNNSLSPASYEWTTLDLSSKQDVVLGVSSTEIGYLDGVTSAIQTQLDAKASLTGVETLTNKTLENPTLTATTQALTSVILINSSGPYPLEVVNYFSTSPSFALVDYSGNTELLPYENATVSFQDTLISGQSIDGMPLTTGAVQFNSGSGAYYIVCTPQNSNDNSTVTSWAAAATGGVSVEYPDIALGILSNSSLTISSTEIGYLDGVTSGIQGQIDDKAPLESPTFTGTVSLPSTITISKIINLSTLVDQYTGEPPIGYPQAVAWSFSSGVLSLSPSYDAVNNVEILIDTNIPNGTTFTISTSSGSKTATFTKTGSAVAPELLGMPVTFDATYVSGDTSSNGFYEDVMSSADSFGSNGQVLQSTGTGVEWGSVPITTGTYTITSNDEEYIDFPSVEGAYEYTIRLKQGGKMRTSKVIVNYISGPPPLSDFTEFAITETGGSILGVNISTVATMMGAALGVTVIDAASTNVDVKFSRVAL